MRDEEHRQVVLPLQPPQQFHDDGLHGHVEGGGHFVADQQFRLDDEGAGDRDPLPFSARQLVGVAGHEVGAE